MGSQPPPNDGAGPSKGKGKASDERETEDGGGAARSRGAGLLSSVARSAQSAVTPESLSSLLSAGGKAVPGVARNGVSGQTFENLQRAATAAGGGPSQQQFDSAHGQTSFRTQGNEEQRVQNNAAYETFGGAGSQQQDLVDRFGQAMHVNRTYDAHPTTLVGPFSSANALDAPMHTHVRGTFNSQPDLSQVWDQANSGRRGEEEYSPEMYDPSYHEAWARTIPAPVFPGIDDSEQRGSAFDALQQRSILGEQNGIDTSTASEVDFMGALDQEESRERLHATVPSIASAPNAGIGTVWRPPTPSERPTLMQEQIDLHRTLAEQQDATEGIRAEERIRPPDDDVDARTGVYAATPEEALRAVWNASGEGERASEFVRETKEQRSTDGANVIRKIRRLLQRGSYVDDVYGIPPALEATIKLAESPETEANRELRAKAIARLDALYKQLDVSATPRDLSKMVDKW